MFWFLPSCQELEKLSWGAGGNSWVGWGGPAPR